VTDRGWSPFARQHRGLGSGPFGYPAGERDQNRPVIFVDHRMGGFKSTLDNDRWRHDNWVGVHAGIGRDGSLDQYASIFDASWGNGVAGSIQRYDRGNPRLKLLETLGRWIAVPYAGTTGYALVAGGVNVINAHSITTEHEDENRDQPWTPAMVATSLRWKKWCIAEMNRFGLTMAIDQYTLVGHFQIDAVNRPGCPGSHWPRLQLTAGLEEDEYMKPEIVWVPTMGAYFVSDWKVSWISSAAELALLEGRYGKISSTMAPELVRALGKVLAG
jgi:hypothetical protein